MITTNGKKVLRLLTICQMQCVMTFNPTIPLAVATVKDVTNSDVYIGSQYNGTYTDSGHSYYPVTNTSSSSNQPAVIATLYNMIFDTGYSVCLNAAGTSFYSSITRNLGCKFILGTGTTAPTENDTFLETPLKQYTVGSSTFTPYLSFTTRGCFIDGDYAVCRWVGYNSSSTETIRFTELGLITRMNTTSGGTTNLTGVVMLGRWVFNEVTVAPNESIEILLKIPVTSLS